MPIPMTAQQQADLSDPSIAKDLVTCLLIETDEGDLAICNRSNSVSYGGHTYEAGIDLWNVEGEISTGSNLVPESLTLTFDASAIDDNASFIGRLVDQSWHLRPVTIFVLIYNAQSGAFIAETRQVRAAADHMDDRRQVGTAALVTLNCETGAFRALRRRRTLCSDIDQRRRLASDAFFRNVGVKGTQQMPFGVSWANVPGAYGASGGGVGGGGSGGGRGGAGRTIEQ